MQTEHFNQEFLQEMMQESGSTSNLQLPGSDLIQNPGNQGLGTYPFLGGKDFQGFQIGLLMRMLVRSVFFSVFLAAI